MNPYDHRPIKFNGVVLPPEMMGISILECFVPMPENVADWLWRLPICKGCEKHSDSFVARNASTFARDAMFEYRSKVLVGIAERFPAYNAESVYSAWVEGFTKVIELSHKTAICRWIAPSSPNDPIQTPSDNLKFLEKLEKFRAKIAEEDSGG